MGVDVRVQEGKNFDETVEAAKITSDKMGWVFIQDMTLDGYQVWNVSLRRPHKAEGATSRVTSNFPSTNRPFRESS